MKHTYKYTAPNLCCSCIDATSIYRTGKARKEKIILNTIASAMLKTHLTGYSNLKRINNDTTFLLM